MSHKFRFSHAAGDSLRSYNDRQPTEPAAKEVPAKKPVRVLPEGSPVVVTRTDVGRVRPTNQDAVIDQWPLLGVADGMGGHKGGETASSGTRDLLCEFLKDKEPDMTVLRTAVDTVNHKLFLKQQEDEKLQGMGTTLTVLWVSPREVLLAHVGDSRCYRLRDGKLEQITQDHSVVAEMVREGLITKEQAHVHPMRNIITRAVATEDTIDADTQALERVKGDIYLVCSDGLHGMMKDEDIQRILADSPDMEAAADALLRLALDNGGKDNVSFALMLDTEGAHE